MFNATGVLTAPLRRDSRTLSVDSVLRAMLIVGQYLRIRGDSGTEIIKVVGIDTRHILIERAKDNTEALQFRSGDLVDYILTAAEISDSYSVSLTLFNSGAIETVDGVVQYTEPNIAVLGASEVIGENSRIVIGRKEEAYGCCDGNNEPAPVPAVPFYLTSQLYPIEAIEELYIALDGVSGRLTSSQPPESTLLAIELLLGTLRTLLKSHAQWPEDFVVTSIEVIEGTLRVLLRTQSQPNEDRLISNIETVSGILKVGLISHTQPVDDKLQFSISVVSGSLV